MLRAIEAQAPRIHVGCGINDAPFTAHRAAHRMEMCIRDRTVHSRRV